MPMSVGVSPPYRPRTPSARSIRATSPNTEMVCLAPPVVAPVPAAAVVLAAALALIAAPVDTCPPNPVAPVVAADATAVAATAVDAAAVAVDVDDTPVAPNPAAPARVTMPAPCAAYRARNKSRGYVNVVAVAPAADPARNRTAILRVQG